MKFKTAKKFIYIFLAGFPAGTKTAADVATDLKTTYKGTLTSIAAEGFAIEAGAVYKIDAGGVGVKFRLGKDCDGVAAIGFANTNDPITKDGWAVVCRPIASKDGEVKIERA